MIKYINLYVENIISNIIIKIYSFIKTKYSDNKM